MKKADGRRDELISKVAQFPQSSGVYLMKGEKEKIIYVGKAKSLRARVRSYFGQGLSRKTQGLVQNILSIDYILTKTEVEAFLLEASLIKKHRPKYNIRLKDDKAYPYIRLSMNDEFPRLYLSRKVKKDGSLYFGPYTSGDSVFGTIRFLNHSFKIRDCADAVFKSRRRPCLTYQIGRCSAPCVGYITKEDYRRDVMEARNFLAGQDKKILKSLSLQMHQAADRLEFEAAAKLRDSLNAISKVLEKQVVMNLGEERDQDVVSFHGDERGVLLLFLFIRKGRMLGTRPVFLSTVDISDPLEDVRDWLVTFLNQYYEEAFVPDELLLPVDIGHDLTRLLGDVLSERAVDKKVLVRFPTDKKGQELLARALVNAEEKFKEAVQKSEEKNQGLMEIQRAFDLKKLPRRIECFDISHFGGSLNVGSQVVFEDGVANANEYRRYRLRTVVNETNDFAALAEVMRRRFEHTEWDRPDLLLIDGGKGQVSAVQRILKELGVEVPFVGIAKARTESDFKSSEVRSTEERFFLPGRQNPIVFKRGGEGFSILAALRDEAHRFAVTYHRKLREQTSLESELDFIEGLGERRKKKLLEVFGSVDGVRSASAQEIADKTGIPLHIAHRIILGTELK